jgi:hypothetical protein
MDLAQGEEILWQALQFNCKSCGFTIELKIGGFRIRELTDSRIGELKNRYKHYCFYFA